MNQEEVNQGQDSSANEADNLEQGLKDTAGKTGAFVRSVFAIDQIDYKQATANIKQDLSFKGFNIWILICSILVCSLGLNLNNTAIVIGAMLISPLMGPINGLGLAIGTYDNALLRRSLKNLAVATVVSILTAAIFFRITPTSANLHELFSRTQPIILDLFVAFFGGVAGILAASRCINTNVVPGVAIATALMPPLCTAGYGLATWQWDYFLGAFYLFFMNCVMISLAAVLIVLYLKYPKFSFVNDAMRRRVKNGIIAFVVIFSVPSIVLYYNVLQEGKEQERIGDFIDHEFKTNNSIYVSSYDMVENDSGKQISVSINGKYLEPSTIHLLESRLPEYKLNDYSLVVYQNESGVKDDDLASIGEKFRGDLLADLYDKNEEQLKNKEDEIALLRSELKKVRLNDLASDKLSKLARSQFDIHQVAIDNIVYTHDEGLDTVATVLVQWKDGIGSTERAKQRQKIKELFQIQLEREELYVLELN